MRPDGPDFISIGMQKSGTGWLYEQLGHHPDIWVPPIKELHYLNDRIRRQAIQKFLDHASTTGLTKLNVGRARKNLWPLGERDFRFYESLAAVRSGKVDLARYCDLFVAKGDQISGDITPAYGTLKRGRIAAVMEYLPRLKIILGIRDPVERFWSQVSQRFYVHEPRKKDSPAFIYDDWRSVRVFLHSEVAQKRSFPTRIATAWREFVPDEQFFIIFFDDLKQDPEAVRGRVLAFLGVDPQKFPAAISASEDSKAKNTRVRMTNEIHEHLAAYFADELRDCAEVFGGPAKEWPKCHGIQLRQSISCEVGR
jgi:hypothetical protein